MAVSEPEHKAGIVLSVRIHISDRGWMLWDMTGGLVIRAMKHETHHLVAVFVPLS
jgi:hypothetical protein